MVDQVAGEWTLVPESPRDIEALREKCRRLVRRKATMAAGMAAIPVPGVDIVSDVGMFAKLVEEVNRTFGLTEEQVERLSPQYRVIAYKAAAGVGGMLVGKLVTRQLVLGLLKRVGMKMAAKQASKVVPFAGQITAAAIGFTVFRRMGYEHVDACAAVARELLLAKSKGAPAA